MAECIKCKQACDYNFHALEIQTLHVRGAGGQKRVQALGAFSDFSVCKTCAKKKLQEIQHFSKKLILPFIISFLAIAAGITSFFLFKNTSFISYFIGGGFIVGGILVIIGTSSKYKDKKKDFHKLSFEDALYQAAWEVVIDKAPKKDGNNDLTYIPVDRFTLNRKNGDLMILYDLLPAIAIEAHKRIHRENAEQKASGN